jgi:hypothetical protein
MGKMPWLASVEASAQGMIQLPLQNVHLLSVGFSFTF